MNRTFFFFNTGAELTGPFFRQRFLALPSEHLNTLVTTMYLPSD